MKVKSTARRYYVRGRQKRNGRIVLSFPVKWQNTGNEGRLQTVSALPVTNDYATTNNNVITAAHIVQNAIQTPSASGMAHPTQEEINAEALAIAKRRFQKHMKTWTELAKY